MDSLEYKKLYELQDEVLEEVFTTESEFYLTGGTCLSRFYKAKRYSDDLDFFTNNSTRFNYAVKNIKSKLLEKHKLKIEIDSKDYVRFLVDDVLQIDFVNDRVHHYKEIVIKDKLILDNIENILSNKLTAVIGRDNPKDIFDIYLIWKYSIIQWKDILKSAHDKASFTNEDLIIRLKTFPKELLASIKLIDRDFLKDFPENFPKLIDEVIISSQID